MANHPKKSRNIRIQLFNDSVFHESGGLNWYQIIGKTIVVMGFFLIVYAVALLLLKDRYNQIGLWVVDHLGLMGVAFFTFFTDMLIVPMSVDILFPFVPSWPPVSLLATMSLASAIGGIGGYWIGRLLGHLQIVQLVTARFSSDTRRLVSHYGVWAVVLAGLTPIPFSTVCWIAGMVKVNPYGVALASLSRIPRMIIYYLLIRGGLAVIF
jgi:membrane protein YqaA with SNARE-associated domain